MTPESPAPSAPAVRASRRWPVVVGLSLSIVSVVAVVWGYVSWRKGILPKIPYVAMLPPANAQSPVLGASKYRIAGHLSGNDELMQSWLQARALPTKIPSAQHL